MNINIFKDQEMVAYVDINKFADNFGKECGITGLREKIEKFKANPIKEGEVIKGTKRTAIRLLIPNLYYDEKIEMGDTVWVYIGDLYERYCLYWPE